MNCAHPDCWNDLTQEDITKGYDHCSEECFQTDVRRPRKSPFEALFDDPYAEPEDAEDD